MKINKDYNQKAVVISRGDEGDEVFRLQNTLAECGYITSSTVERFGMGDLNQFLPSVKEGVFDESYVFSMPTLWLAFIGHRLRLDLNTVLWF